MKVPSKTMTNDNQNARELMVGEQISTRRAQSSERIGIDRHTAAKYA